MQTRYTGTRRFCHLVYELAKAWVPVDPLLECGRLEFRGAGFRQIDELS